MRTIFDKVTTEELIDRIQKLQSNSIPQWGNMTVYQMMKHCTLWEELIMGDKKYPRMLIGRLFGKLALKGMLKNDKPMPRNAPTVPGFKVTDNGDAATEKAKWISMVQQHHQFSNSGFVHPFFGKMTKEQIGQLAYKHTDHHLRQFNV